MKIKLIDYGYERAPLRAHDNDAGADVYATKSYILKPGEVVKIPLGFGLELPDGYAAFVFPRSSMAARGLDCELPPIDSGYRGEIHAIVTNNSNRKNIICEGDRVGQIVVVPVVVADFVKERGEERGTGAFGSTGK